jgi:hypothetical protein
MSMSAIDFNRFAGRLASNFTPRRSLVLAVFGGLATLTRSTPTTAKNNHKHKSRDKAKQRCQQQLDSCVDQSADCPGQVAECSTVLTAFCGTTPECATLVNCCNLLGTCDATNFLACINQPEPESP